MAKSTTKVKKDKKDKKEIGEKRKQTTDNAYAVFDRLKGMKPKELNDKDLKDYITALGQILRVVNMSEEIIGKSDVL